jgi:hypothetical protein
MVAELVRQGSYPRLTAEMIPPAPIYAVAYPLRGPKRKLQLSDRQRHGRRKLNAVAVWRGS